MSTGRHTSHREKNLQRNILMLNYPFYCFYCAVNMADCPNFSLFTSLDYAVVFDAAHDFLDYPALLLPGKSWPIFE